jgi:hypothetical protein
MIPTNATMINGAESLIFLLTAGRRRERVPEFSSLPVSRNVPQVL